MSFSDKVLEMARMALEKRLENPEADLELAKSPEKQAIWIDGYASALHSLGADTMGDLFEGLEDEVSRVDLKRFDIK